VGSGFVQAATGASVVIDLSDAEEGSQYVLMPYALGDLATVAGAGTEALTFTVKGEAGAGGAATGGGDTADAGDELQLMPLRSHKARAAHALSWIERDHLTRTLLNRFDPKLGLNQEPGFWARARALDAAVRGGGVAGLAFADAAPGPTESYFQRVATSPHRARRHAAASLTASAACPTEGEEIDMPEGSDPEFVAVPAGGVVENADYCIVYLADPKTEPSKDAIKSSIEAVMKRYKDVIYKDKFAAVGDYVFKPTFAIVDTSGWPEGIKTVAGIFVGAASVEAGHPLLYLTADIAKVTPGVDADVAKRVFHGTIAHEMQHAIHHYYRVVVNGGKIDIASVDEGIAHFMEDLFGYGQENFETVAQPFLSDFFDSQKAVLSEQDDSLVARGGGQAFMYYLENQKGPIEFDNGVVTGGPGLDLLVTITKAKTSGAAGVAAALGVDAAGFTKSVGSFMGAIAINGSSIDPIAAQFQTQPIETIADLNGHADKQFGMKFNGWGDLTLLPKDRKWETSTAATSTTESLTYYSTQGLLYTAKAGGAKLTFSLPTEVPNTAVSVVRIK
jgi:hypothetical protein